MTWRVKVRIGDLIVEHTRAGPTDPPPPLPALVSVSWLDALDAEQLWPAIQGPSTGTLRLAAAAASDVAGIDSEDPVAVELYRPATSTEPVASFYGRAGDPEIVPHPRGVLVTIPIRDYLTDLADHTVGDAAWPSERAGARIDRALSAVGLAPLDLVSPGWPVLAARSAQATPLLQLLQETLSWSVRDEDILGFASRILWELRPTVWDGELDPDYPWDIVPVAQMRRSAGGRRPVGVTIDADWFTISEPVARAFARLVLDQVTGRWHVIVDQDDPEVADQLIPAGVTLFDATWSRRAWSHVDTVDVITASKARARTTRWDGTGRRTVTRRETQLVDVAAAKVLADVLIGNANAYVGTGWEAETFTVMVDETSEDWWPGQLRDARTLAGLQARHHPEGISWWLGVITGLQPTIEAGRLTVAVTLRPVPIVPAGDGVTFDQVAAHGITLDDLDPSVTFNQLEYVHTIT